MFRDRVARSLYALLCASAGPLSSILSSSPAIGKERQA